MKNTSILSGLSNGNRTDLSAGIITNSDAVLLLLHSLGGTARTRDLKALLNQWRGPRSYGYLFQNYEPGWSNGYGFVGRTFEQATTQITEWGFEDFGRRWTRRNYYYTLRRGTVAISAEGFRRLGELGKDT
jgi:hypothetical protein